MSEGKWVEAKHEDIRKGDAVRVTRKDGPQTITTEGKVTHYEEGGNASRKTSWTIENFEYFYDYEFVPNSDGEFSTLERFVPAFEWPTKLGAVVTGKDEEGEYTAVLVYVPVNTPGKPVWWTAEWGVTGAEDLSGLEDLTVVSEGVTVES